MVDNNLLFLYGRKSYLTVSIIEKLVKHHLNVIECGADLAALETLDAPLDAILLHIDEELVAFDATIVKIKDYAVANDIPIFVLGNVEEIDAIKLFLPSHLIQKEFIRPIDVEGMANDISDVVANHHGREKKKILVVDDSGQVLRSVKNWLDDKYNVICANSGVMAIKYLTINRPDLVLLDYEMPVVTGAQVLEMIRMESEFKDVPVIFLTAKGDMKTVMEVMELNPEGYLLKSMKPFQIVKAVDDFFIKHDSGK